MCLSGATYLPAHFVIVSNGTVLCGHDNRKDSECQMEQCIVGMTDLKIVIVSNGTVLCGHDRLKDSDSVKWNTMHCSI
jgi:hypothetical protein